MDAPKFDDLSDLERRLSAWRPSTDGLSADALLFAAGRASVRAGRGRYVWPTLAISFALLAALMSGWAASERTERLAIARQMREKLSISIAAPDPVPPQPSIAREKLPPDSLLAAHLSLAKDFDAWLARNEPSPGGPLGPSVPSQPVLRVGQSGDVLEP